MEKNKQFKQEVKQALLSPDPAYMPPPLSQMKELRELVKNKSAIHQQRPEILPILLQFLNLRVKLYHVVLGVLIIWFCILFLQKTPTEKHEVNNSPLNYGLASTNNSTVLCSIATNIKK